MATPRVQVSQSTAPSQVWAELAPASQQRAVQLLAQRALNFLTAQTLTAQKEEAVCSNSAITPRYAPIISPDQH
jgi:hypothetical protein